MKKLFLTTLLLTTTMYGAADDDSDDYKNAYGICEIDFSYPRSQEVRAAVDPNQFIVFPRTIREAHATSTITPSAETPAGSPVAPRAVVESTVATVRAMPMSASQQIIKDSLDIQTLRNELKTPDEVSFTQDEYRTLIATSDLATLRRLFDLRNYYKTNLEIEVSAIRKPKGD